VIAKITSLLGALKKLDFKMAQLILGVLSFQLIIVSLSGVYLNRTFAAMTSSAYKKGQVLSASIIRPVEAAASRPSDTQTAAISGGASTAAVQQAASLPITACSAAGIPTLESLNLLGLSAGLHTIIEPVKNYRIYGDTPQQILTQLQQCGPLSGSGNRWAANTSYALKWNFGYTVSPADARQCVLNNIVVIAQAGITMPYWEPSASAQADLAARWNRVSANLRIHENGHVQLAVTAGQSLMARLQDLPAMNCADIGHEAMRIGSDELSKLMADNDSYDEVTNHGQTQGTSL
jgi:predicted secreted Zn-dependent protease